jgi:hypothetical protein
MRSEGIGTYQTRALAGVKGVRRRGTGQAVQMNAAVEGKLVRGGVGGAGVVLRRSRPCFGLSMRVRRANA